MANTLVPQDVYELINEVAAQATGRNDISVVDTSSFVAVGEMLVRTAAENTLNAISTITSRTIFSVRPYKGKLDSLRVAQERWGALTRKIIPLYKEAEASEDWNTEQNPTALADGGTVDHYKINKPEVIQLNFVGTKVLQKHITIFRDQLSQAFRSESEFVSFLDAVMTQFMNEIEILNEAETRATLVNYIAGLSAMGLEEVDLVAEFNIENGTTYTRGDLLGKDHIEEFMKFVASTIKIYSGYLTDITTSYHASISNYSKIMRHTPKEKQKMIMYEPVFTKMQAEVYSSIFNPEYLNIGEYEGVNYWQAKNDPTAIDCKPNILDVSTGASKTSDVEVNLPYVLGVLFDTEAIGVVPQFEYSSTTPENSAGGYFNTYYHWRFNSQVDYTENAVLFVLGEGGE